MITNSAVCQLLIGLDIADQNQYGSTICFRDWFHTVALPFMKWRKGRKLLLGDNLSSHFSEDVIDECHNYDINYVCLPPNSIHFASSKMFLLPAVEDPLA